MKVNKTVSLNVNANRVLCMLVLCISFTILLEINNSSNIYAKNQTINNVGNNNATSFLLLTLH